MQTLRQIRNDLGITQGEVAAKINVSIPAYSLYESGQSVPCLEDCIILEKNFNQRINWTDQSSCEDKAKIMEALTILSEHYPLMTVLNFAQRALRDSTRINPKKLIIHYKNAAQGIEPLLMPE